MKISTFSYRHQQGFTLMEIMIVVFIIGLTVSLMSLSVGGAKDESAPHKEAAALMQAMDFVGEQAALNGELIAMFVAEKDADDGLQKQWCYNWMRFLDGGWQSLVEDTLTEHCMEAGIQWDIVLEGKIYNYDANLETQPPVLLFSPSGETTAAEMAIYEHGSTLEPQHIELDLVGTLRWRNEEEKEERRGRK